MLKATGRISIFSPKPLYRDRSNPAGDGLLRGCGAGVVRVTAFASPYSGSRPTHFVGRALRWVAPRLIRVLTGASGATRRRGDAAIVIEMPLGGAGTGVNGKILTPSSPKIPSLRGLT